MGLLTKAVYEDNLLTTKCIDLSEKGVFRGCLEIVYNDKSRKVFDGEYKDIAESYHHFMSDNKIAHCNII